ncbi:hypothetical protein TDB9533_03309 [Thalassocella blandensis]|nr:hypothetical protein TDB9533_03309 [Thalassocella blandensis]
MDNASHISAPITPAAKQHATALLANPMIRYVLIAESITLLILVFIAVPLKHLAGLPTATKIAGSIHGIVFLYFLWILIRAYSSGLLPWRLCLRLLIGSVIPFGGLFNERWLRTHVSAQDKIQQ